MTGWWLASYLLLWALLALTVVVLLIVLRQLGLLYLRSRAGGTVRIDEGPPIDTPLRFDEIDRSGAALRFPTDEKPLNVVLFTSPWCSICKDAVRGLSSAARHYNAGAFIIDAGDITESDVFGSLAGQAIPVVSSLPLQRRIGVTTIPYAIVTDRNGTVVSKGLVNQIDDVEDLLAVAEGRVMTSARETQPMPA